jgi:translocator protein
LVWKANGLSAALVVWGFGIVFNAAWSWLMFGEHNIELAFYDLAAMWLSIVAFILLAWPIDYRASVLFLPYLVWTTYAGALNWEVWRLNPTV